MDHGIPNNQIEASATYIARPLLDTWSGPASTELFTSRRQVFGGEGLTMRTTISLAQLLLPARPGSTARLRDLVALTKPRVMLLAVFTAFVGLAIAPAHVD